MPWLALRLLGLKSALGRALGVVGRYPWQAAVLALALASLWLWHGKGVEHRRADRWYHAASAVRHAKDAQRFGYIAAGQAAEVKDILAREHTAKLNMEITDAVAANHVANSAAVTRAVADYARLHPAGNALRGGDTQIAGVSGNPPVDVVTGGAPDMVAVSRADLDTLSTAAMRAAEDREWALALIAAGLAVGE